MSVFSFSTLIRIIKIIIILRILAYGASRIVRHFMWQQEMKSARNSAERLAQGIVRPPGKNRSFLGRYGTILIGTGILGLFVVRRVHPDYRKPGKEATTLEVIFYTLLPLRIMSRLWGTLTNIDLPVFMRHRVYSLYASSFGVNLDECEVQDLTCYKSLSEFFIRPLKEECRPIDPDCTCIVSPADGRVLSFGKITSCQVDQVKGVTYSLQQFLGRQSWKKTNNPSTSNQGRITKYPASNPRESESSSEDEEDGEEGTEDERLKMSVAGFPGCSFEPAESCSHMPSGEYLKRLKEKTDTELYQCVVYLAPGDYHRFHSPVSWKVNFRRHFQGKLLSVNPAVASWISNLFALNERAVYVGSWEHGFFSLTAVGATNVGFIRVVFDPTLHTNKWTVYPRERDLHFTKDWEEKKSKTKLNFDKPVEIEKGQLFGEFRLGSTIVLIFEAPKDFQFFLEKGQKIKYGERIGAYAPHST